MHMLTVNGVHLLGAALGFFLIHVLATTPRFRPLLWPFVVAFGAALAVFLFFQTDPWRAFNDFRRCYWLAGDLIWQGPQALAGAYAPQTLLFVNLPVVAYLFAPYGLMPAIPAAIVHSILGAGLVLLTWRMLVKHFALDLRESAFLLFAFMVSGPMIYTFREGNTSEHVLFLLVSGWLLQRDGRGLLAGAVFALAALIKPALILVGVYYLLRGRWNVVLGGAATIGGAVAASLLIFGWDMHVLWYETSIAPFTRNPVPAYAVQTLQALVLRFEIGGPAGHDWAPHALSAAGTIASGLLIGLLVAGALFAAWRSGRLTKPTQRDLDLELFLVVNFALVASSLSWAHYYVWLFPAFVLAWVETRPGAALARLRWSVIVAFALASGVAFVSEQMAAGKFGPFSNLVASHWLLGALMLFGFTAWLRARRAEDVQPAAVTANLAPA